MHFKAGRRVRSANQGNDYFIAFQRFATPRSSDMTEHAMLDLVPLTGSRWKVAYFDRNGKFVCESLQFVLPEPVARTVAAAAVRCYKNPAELCFWVSSSSQPTPPGAYRSHREFCRVMRDSHIDPGFISGDVVDTVGYCLDG